jgi:hypothetical protein
VIGVGGRQSISESEKQSRRRGNSDDRGCIQVKPGNAGREARRDAGRQEERGHWQGRGDLINIMNMNMIDDS